MSLTAHRNLRVWAHNLLTFIQYKSIYYTTQDSYQSNWYYTLGYRLNYLGTQFPVWGVTGLAISARRFSRDPGFFDESRRFPEPVSGIPEIGRDRSRGAFFPPDGWRHR